MSPHDLKKRLILYLNGLTFQHEINPLIPLHVNLRKINDLDVFVETHKVADEFYNVLENLYLQGSNSYPIILKHINDIIPEIEKCNNRISIYLKQYEISHKETSLDLILVDVRKLQRVRPIGYETFGNPDLELVANYNAYENLNQSLNKLINDLNFLKDQIGSIRVPKSKLSPNVQKVPDLKDVFINDQYFEKIVAKTKGKFHEFDSTTGHYNWTAGDEYLAALAFRLREMHRLKYIYDINNNQFLRRVFSKFFHKEVSEKTFQPSRVNERKKREFSFIVESDK
jgi:hypothetical protein